MKDYKMILISFVLLIFMIGAVSAASSEEATIGDIPVVVIEDDPVVVIEDDPVVVIEDDPIIGDDNSNIKDIYVNDTGDDSNVGTANSPYATIGKAIADVNTSNIATIHLSEGTFADDNDVNFNLGRFQQTVDGGSLTFIGAGADKTIIDGQDYFKFATLGYNTNITFKDITFTNFVRVIDDYGGILTIENCIFKDSFTNSAYGGAISMRNNGGTLTVKDSQFISCVIKGEDPWGTWKGGGAIHAYDLGQVTLVNNVFIGTTSGNNPGAAIWSNSKTYIDGNKFINITGTYDASIFLNSYQGLSTIVNNEFIDCSNPSTSSSIVNLANGKYELKNNTFTNSSNVLGNIYATGSVSGLIYTMSDEVIEIGNAEINKGVDILVNATDDMGNIVKTTAFTINFVNDENSYSFNPSNNNGYAHINFYSMPEIGIYNVSLTVNGETTDVLTTADIHYSSEPVELYVSPDGDDAANGTHDAPFETIQHALDVGFEKTFNVVINLLKGTYFGDGNVELEIYNKGTLQLIGEAYGETIIDGNDENWFLSIGTDAVIKNITFVNGFSDWGYAIEGDSDVYLKDCIVDNCYSEGIVVHNINIDNLTFTNNAGHVELGWNYYEVKNSYFANNTSPDMNGGALYVGSDEMTVENCTFINNTGQMGGAIYIGAKVDIINNYFEGNSALYGGALYISGSDQLSFEKNTFINNKATESGVFAFMSADDWNEASYTPTLTFTECDFINNSAQKAGVATLKVGKFVDCSFVNNSADYGGVFVLLPYIKEAGDEDEFDLLGAQIIIIDPINPGDDGERLYSLILNNTVFENNIADVNGNDIYFGAKSSNYWGQDSEYQYAIPLTITFNDSNVTSLVDNLTATVYGPSNTIIGADYLSFEFNGEKIGSTNIVNSVAIFTYSGFDDGEYVLSGNTYLPCSENVINKANVTVKLENVLDHVEVWVSTTGDDENGTGNESSPFKSISHAIVESTKNCRNVLIHIGEGVFTGDLNTALELSSMNNLTLMGAGVGKTVIDGEDAATFATVTDGRKNVTVSDLTIKNMLPDNKETLVIDSSCPITIIEGGNLYLRNVEMIDNHGGQAIIKNNGNLAIDNSVFRRNGLTTNGIIFGGNANIYNSTFEDNFANSGLFTADNLVISNSKILNSYNLGAYDLINKNSNAQGNVTIINTIIINEGSTEKLNELGVVTTGKTVVPAVNVNGNVYMNNGTMVNNFAEPRHGGAAVASITVPSAFGYTYTVPRNVFVFNSTFINYDYLWTATTYDVHNFIFDGCVFENLEYIAWIRTNNENSNYNITNSVFLNCTPMINQVHYMQMATPQHVNLNNNYWGNNSKPIIYFSANNGIKEEVVAPETWITLYSEDEMTVIKNITDGENSTEYLGVAPIRTDYADNNGALDYAVVFGPVGYLFTTDDDNNVIFDSEDSMAPFVAADPMDYRMVTAISIVGFEGDLGIIGILTDSMGLPVENATIIADFNITEPSVTTTDALGLFKVQGAKNGVLSIIYLGDDYYFPAAYILTFIDAGKTTKTFINIDAIDELAIGGNLVDDEGTPIANATILYVINGNQTGNTTTDANGAFQIQGESNAVVDIIFEGSETADAVNATFTMKDVAPLRVASQFTNIVISGDAVITATLVDGTGAPIANATVSYIINGVPFNATTDASGAVVINATSNSVVALDYAGNGMILPVNTTIALKDLAPLRTATSIKAEDYYTDAIDYYAGERGGYFKVQLVDESGAPIANKTVKIGFNGVVYEKPTDENGWAQLQINLAGEGTYTFAVAFLGDDDYNASFVVQKIIVSKKKTSIDASAKSYKASAKTKSYTVTLKTDKGSSVDGKTYLKAGKKVTLKVNGKTYTAKTNAKGQATFKLSITKKGKYSASIKFEGDKTYAASSKTAKITIN